MGVFDVARQVTPPAIRRLVRRVKQRHQIQRILRAFDGTTSLSVKSGPFKGMRYIWTPDWGGFGARLLGSYEKELHPSIEDACATPLSVIIDIGCAEGYYAVGMALRCPQSSVYAYDIDPIARRQCGELAVKNGVDGRVSIGGECTTSELKGRLTAEGSSLVICDCEGAEIDLLDPTAVPALRAARIVVETHDFILPGAKATLIQRFANTHAIREIASEPRSVADFPPLASLSVPDQEIAFNERRPGTMYWLVMEPR